MSVELKFSDCQNAIIFVSVSAAQNAIIFVSVSAAATFYFVLVFKHE